jgi:hypothetical protein
MATRAGPTTAVQYIGSGASWLRVAGCPRAVSRSRSMI